MIVLASFQKCINKISTKKFDIFVILYLDDILIYINDNGDSHITAVWLVLEKLRKFLLYTTMKKY